MSRRNIGIFSLEICVPMQLRRLFLRFPQFWVDFEISVEKLRFAHISSTHFERPLNFSTFRPVFGKSQKFINFLNVKLLRFQNFYLRNPIVFVFPPIFLENLKFLNIFRLFRNESKKCSDTTTSHLPRSTSRPATGSVDSKLVVTVSASCGGWWWKVASEAQKFQK